MGIFLTEKELQDAYADSEKWTKDWHKPFDEYERLANNKLSKTLPKNMPKVNDGSLATSLLETPTTIFPAMQEGKFTSNTIKKPWLNEIINIIWKTIIVPNATTQAPFFDKELMALYRALIYGAQPRYNFFRSDENYTGSDWSLPYIRNLKLEPGKYSVDDSDYLFLDVYFTKLQLKRIIDNIKTANKQAKSEGSKLDTSWDTKSLEKLANMSLSAKEIENQNINERDRVYASGIKTTLCFNRGKQNPFYMFSKHLASDEILRKWDNPDPTGDLPITMQYCYETLESPFGIGRVQLAGPTQNVIDYMTQAHVLATQIGIQPPKKFKGDASSVNANSFVMSPDATWKVGAQGDIELMKTTGEVYTQFPTVYGLYKTQLQNLQGRTDASVSASSGNPMFSKTPAGVRFQEERTNAQDNYLRNKADSASAKMATKMMNVHLAQKQGADILDIAEEERERLYKAGYFDENPTTEDIPSLNEVGIMYDEIRDTVKFEFNPRPEADEDQKARWTELIEITAKYPNIIPALQADGYNLSLGEMFKKVVASSGADGWDKVLVKIDPEQQASEQGIDPETGLPIEQIDPNMPMEQPIEEMGQPVEQPVEPQIDLVQQIMEMYGVDENTASRAAISASNAEQNGYDPQQVLDYIFKGEESEGLNA